MKNNTLIRIKEIELNGKVNFIKIRMRLYGELDKHIYYYYYYMDDLSHYFSLYIMFIIIYFLLLRILVTLFFFLH